MNNRTHWHPVRPRRSDSSAFFRSSKVLPQPLCGLYHRALARGLRRALEQGKRKITTAIQEAIRDSTNTTEIQSRGYSFRIELWDAEVFAASLKTSSGLSVNEWFLNINTPEDWERAQKLFSAEA